MSPQKTVTHLALRLSPTELSKRPYKVRTPSGDVSVFFYHGELAQSVAFGGVLNNGQAFAEDLVRQARELEPNALIHFATDGESYGHHHPQGNLALGHMIQTLRSYEDIRLTSYSAYLRENPATWTAQIHENSAWSCAHGVGRWKEDCGCNTGQQPRWHQSWRKPLRSLFDWIQSTIAPEFEKQGQSIFRDPWEARNGYIEYLLEPTPAKQKEFELKYRRAKPWTDQEQTKAFGLLEMQRRLLNMYTSCGWFFDDVSGLEPLQNIRHALEASRLAAVHLGMKLETTLRQRCYAVPSNMTDAFHEQLDRIFDTPRSLKQHNQDERQAGILLHISSPSRTPRNRRSWTRGPAVRRLDGSSGCKLVAISAIGPNRRERFLLQLLVLIVGEPVARRFETFTIPWTA